jgi:tRNA threonylcarbamoyladenosine biosynthesis protein TsaB
MSLILCLETTTKVCSVAISKNGEVIASKESHDEQYSHSENLTLFIQETISQTNYSLKNIDEVAISKGPGSYTGLRIGVSTAKSLCYALDKPLIAINSLTAMTAGCLSNSSTPKSSGMLYCPMIDARRMEVYCTLLDDNLTEIEPTQAKIIEKDSFNAYLEKGKIFFFGDGADKCSSKLNHPNAIFIKNQYPSAKYMAKLAEKLFTEKLFEDVAYFEPFYLKDFVSSTPPSRIA